MSRSHRSFILQPSTHYAAGCVFETEWKVDDVDELELRVTVRNEEGRLFTFWSLEVQAATALYEAMVEADHASFYVDERREDGVNDVLAGE